MQHRMGKANVEILTANLGCAQMKGLKKVFLKKKKVCRG